MALSFVSDELAVVGALGGVAKLRRCQVVLPLLCSGETTIFAGDRWVSPFSPQISSGACVLVGVGSVGFSCFVSAKGCELPLIPPTGRWIPAVEVVPGGGGWSRRVLGEEDADALSVLYMRLDGGSGSLAFAALHVMVFFVGLGWARRRAASGSCGASSRGWKMKLEEEFFYRQVLLVPCCNFLFFRGVGCNSGM